ncbi:hypothetical protein GPJ56_010675 [Histomonas meleagridis]|uniref:uncharacterized protein n=1 Tax=Histomonas meleagridis TaxID=135588 RepID=UPI00355A31B8|nr:hypothetical protein GPJ56_010675 [Histomonas meleagridis]KAH0801007.1 hypothetical protein GO595_006042 [Histomonas meleagridis]
MSSVTPHPSIYRVSCYGCGQMYVRRSENDKCPFCGRSTIKYYECKCANCGHTVTVNSFDDACKYCAAKGKWTQGSYDGKVFRYVIVKQAPQPRTETTYVTKYVTEEPKPVRTTTTKTTYVTTSRPTTTTTTTYVTTKPTTTTKTTTTTTYVTTKPGSTTTTTTTTSKNSGSKVSVKFDMGQRKEGPEPDCLIA